ncbi:hypothetical protein GALMADRAFT_220039 [Galerina marginata CBS 339.88]|uniref:DUF6593 domain-containing protein n=1 Tax=Galerina marginata (strain CBS 339.88) TaxID=685588 RepID=A0A067TLY8_GALM3|nr:hypothetical protein GALMADRAFT_220039 [Galerina marginata CBS 339.88]
MSSSSGPYALLQYGDDPLSHRFIDHEGRAAFTIVIVSRSPNPVIRLTREPAWSQQHPSIMGPDNSYFYLGPESTSGYIVYGNNRTNIPMNFFLRPGKREGSLSRYFRCQNGKDYKWRIGSHRMECLDGRTTLATWEVSPPDQEYYARLIIKPNAMSLVTEIVTTLILNRMALALGW